MRSWLWLLILMCGMSCLKAQDLTTVPPGGESAVGYRTMTLETPRPDSLAGGNVQRRLQLEIWYPAASAQGPLKPWADPAMGHALSSDFPLPEGFESKIKARAYAGAPVAAGKFPVVLFSHGLSWPVTLYQSYTEDLASRGYIVIGVNHPHGAALIEYDDGKRLGMSAWPTIENEAKREMFLARHAQEWTSDLTYVLDRITTGNLMDGLPADSSRIAVIGHSYGGTAAGRLSRDPRIRAAVAMEGAVRDPSDKHARGSLTVGVPFLHLIGGYNRLELDNSSYQPSAGAPVYVAVVQGTGHAYFSDLIHFYRAFADADWKRRHRYELDPDRVIQISRDVIADFLGRYLRGENHSVLLNAPSYADRVDSPTTGGYPELDMRVLLAPPPQEHQ